MSCICNGNGNMFRRHLYGFVWKYVGGVMYSQNVFGKYGKYIDGLNGNHLLWGSYGSYYVNSDTQWKCALLL